MTEAARCAKFGLVGNIGTRVAVIIPAHDESRAIAACLAALTTQDFSGPMAITVVANGCSDGTGAAAQSTGDPRITVVETSQASKPAALNLADHLVTDADVRIYLDADILLSPDAIRRVVEGLRARPDVHLASPRLVVHLPQHAVAASYATVWGSLPYVTGQVIGCGFYAVTAQGRSRWGAWPDIVSDDKYARLHFRPEEMVVVPDAEMTVFLPESARELVAVRGRWCRGNRQLRKLYPNLAAHDARHVMMALRHIVTTPRLWRHAPIFAVVYALGMWSAWRKVWWGIAAWERGTSAAIRVQREAG